MLRITRMHPCKLVHNFLVSVKTELYVWFVVKGMKGYPFSADVVYGLLRYPHYYDHYFLSLLLLMISTSSNVDGHN